MADTAKESVSLPADLSEAAKKAAAKEHRSFSSLVSVALQEWLRNHGYEVAAGARDHVADIVREAEDNGVDVPGVLSRALRKIKRA